MLHIKARLRTRGMPKTVTGCWSRGSGRAACARPKPSACDAWLKDIAPSQELRRWFGHDPARWSEFAAR